MGDEDDADYEGEDEELDEDEDEEEDETEYEDTEEHTAEDEYHKEKNEPNEHGHNDNTARKIEGKSGAETCSDLHADCPRWYSMGECANNPKYMLEFCRKSCRACTSDTSSDRA